MTKIKHIDFGRSEWIEEGACDEDQTVLDKADGMPPLVENFDGLDFDIAVKRPGQLRKADRLHGAECSEQHGKAFYVGMIHGRFEYRQDSRVITLKTNWLRQLFLNFVIC